MIFSRPFVRFCYGKEGIFGINLIKFISQLRYLSYMRISKREFDAKLIVLHRCCCRYAKSLPYGISEISSSSSFLIGKLQCCCAEQCVLSLMSQFMNFDVVVDHRNKEQNCFCCILLSSMSCSAIWTTQPVGLYCWNSLWNDDDGRGSGSSCDADCSSNEYRAEESENQSAKVSSHKK